LPLVAQIPLAAQTATISEKFSRKNRKTSNGLFAWKRNEFFFVKAIWQISRKKTGD
jgi:hypothetical protein